MDKTCTGDAVRHLSRAQLAALIIAGGLLSTTPVHAGPNSAHGLWLKDRTNLIAHKAKDSTCGKCGANACGESYQDRKRQKRKSTGSHTSQRLRTPSKNGTRRTSKPLNR
ncbi:MAG TPA: hypothetical protein V6D22_14450 [Candidatus Obscuribacterales bacterium]